MKLNVRYKQNANFSYLFFLIFCLPLLSFGQQDSLKKEDKTQITDFYISYGASRFPVFNISQEKFKEIVPKSRLLNGEIMEADFNDYGGNAGGFTHKVDNTTPYLQAGVTLRLRNREFKNAGPWLKLGFNYFSTTTLLSTGVFTNTTVRTDTAYYTGSGAPVTREVFTRNQLTYVYTCESINAEGTLIYKLNPEGIFSLFGGPGAMLGANFGGRAELASLIQTTTTDYLSASSPTASVLDKKTVESRDSELFNLGPNLSFGIFVNVGVDLRLGNKYEIIKNTHAYFEAKPIFRMYGVKGAGMQNSVLLVLNGGLRYEF